jgi:hypothetical protein
MASFFWEKVWMQPAQGPTASQTVAQEFINTLEDEGSS